MIIVRLWGGLGNQMFQYAAARRLAHVNGDRLKLDVSWFGRQAQGDTPRRYELGVFDILEEFASSAETARLRGPDIRRWPRFLKRLAAPLGIPRRTYVGEKHYHFDPQILELRGDVYLDGYWQSGKYFQDAADVIREEFTLKSQPTESNARLLEEIADCDSVSVHFRRGDYVTNPSAAAYHGVASLDYYAAAMSEVRRRVPESRFFLFSDEPEWVKQNFKTDLPLTYVEGNGPDRGGEDLRLMSACRHHIVANSSFSWWGAWLGGNREKVVVAPQRWFMAGDNDTKDLIPEEWLKI